MPLGYYLLEPRADLAAGYISRHNFSPSGLKFNRPETVKLDIKKVKKKEEVSENKVMTICQKYDALLLLFYHSWGWDEKENTLRGWTGKAALRKPSEFYKLEVQQVVTQKTQKRG